MMLLDHAQEEALKLRDQLNTQDTIIGPIRDNLEQMKDKNRQMEISQQNQKELQVQLQSVIVSGR